MDYLSELRMHSPSNIVSMAISFIWTKLFFRNAQLIRRPFYLRGSKKNLHLGKGFRTGRGNRFELFEDGQIAFGRNCHIGDYVHVAASESINIGDNCLFASKIFISDTGHGSYAENGSSPESIPEERPLVSDPVQIGDNVWLGEGVVVLAGVSIGKGSVIGANSVVCKNIPPNTIAAGSPARPIKRYDFDLGEWVKC